MSSLPRRCLGDERFDFDPGGRSCALCGERPATVMDHDHRTGLCRGWVCRSCNAAARHPEVLIRALAWCAMPAADAPAFAGWRAARGSARDALRRQEVNARGRARYAALSPEDRARRNALTPERRERKNERARARMAALSPEAREARNARQRAWHAERRRKEAR